MTMPDRRGLAQRTLERAGYAVAVAGDGDTGLALYATGVYDVLMVDHQMPGTGGLEVLRTLTTWGALPPTIMVTGHGDEAIAVEAMKLGAGDYVVKDVDGRYLTLLPTVVARVLHQQRLLEEKRQAEAALQQTLAALETRVQERTAALQQANAQLRAEIAERMRAEAALAQLNRRHDSFWIPRGKAFMGSIWRAAPPLSTRLRHVCSGGRSRSCSANRCTTSCATRCAMGCRAPTTHAPSWPSCRDGVVRHVPEDVFWRKDGTQFFVEYVGTPIHEHDTLVGAVIIFKDITERRRIEREMQRADRLALVGQLASGLAHEIGTPLNIIAGNAELLGMDLRDRGLGTAEVDAIIQHADRITRLIQQLLTFARAKAQAMTPLAVQDPLANALSLLETRFKRQNIAVRLEVPGTLPLIAAVPSSSNKYSSMCWSMPGMPCPTGVPSPLPPLQRRTGRYVSVLWTRAWACPRRSWRAPVSHFTAPRGSAAPGWAWRSVSKFLTVTRARCSSPAHLVKAPRSLWNSHRPTPLTFPRYPCHHNWASCIPRCYPSPLRS